MSRAGVEMQTIEHVLRAVDRFEDCASGGDDFGQALIALSDALAADCATLEVADRPSGAMKLNAHARLDPDSLDAYLDHYQAISPRVRYGLSANARPVAHDADVLSEDAMARDPFYAEFLPRYRLRYFLSIAIDPNPETFAVVAFQFAPGHGVVEPDKLRVAEAMRPLLRRAMQRFWRRDIDRDPERLSRELQRRFRLTPAEAELALSLLAGLPLAAHAERVGITRNTTYTHYARLKAKLGCHRQVELLSQLNRIQPAGVLLPH